MPRPLPFPSFPLPLFPLPIPSKRWWLNWLNKDYKIAKKTPQHRFAHLKVKVCVESLSGCNSNWFTGRKQEERESCWSAERNWVKFRQCLKMNNEEWNNQWKFVMMLMFPHVNGLKLEKTTLPVLYVFTTLTLQVFFEWKLRSAQLISRS